MLRNLFALAALFMVLAGAAYAQQNAAEEAQRRTDALANLPADAARRLFSEAENPAKLPAHVFGTYNKGCFAGGENLPPDGPGWQVMRLSRHRSFGHPKLIAWLEKFAARAKEHGWLGLLIGDMAQPRGGPMITGHASHQLGLEADIWLTPAPDHTLNPDEREEMSAIDMVQPDLLDVYHDRFLPAQLTLLKDAASMPNVDRIFVNAAIKQEACRAATGDRGWLHKLRPWTGHTYHFHVALKCEDAGCGKGRPEIPPGDGCGKDLAYWFREDVRFPKPKPNQPPPKPLSLKDLPKECEAVLKAQ